MKHLFELFEIHLKIVLLRKYYRLFKYSVIIQLDSPMQRALAFNSKGTRFES